MGPEVHQGVQGKVLRGGVYGAYCQEDKVSCLKRVYGYKAREARSSSAEGILDIREGKEEEKLEGP